jgi:adenylate cyclase
VVRVRPPIDVLTAATAGGGHVATAADGDGKFRSSVLLVDYGNGLVFPHAVLDTVARQVWKIDGRQPGTVTLQDGWLKIGSHRIGPLTRRELSRSYRDFRSKKVSREAAGVAWLAPLNFMGDHETMQYLTIPYAAVLDGSAADALKGRIVIVGGTATGTPDLRPGPFDRHDIFLGVETIATLLANLLNNDFLHYPPRSWALLAMLLCGGAAGLSIALCRPAWAVAATAATLGLYFVLAVALFMSRNLVLEMGGTLWAATLCFVGMSIYRLVFIDRAAREAEMALQESQALLGQFVDPALARELSENRDLRQSMQIGTRREVTILFSDIRGFTSWSDQQPPEEVVARLGEYFPIMCEIARDEYDGFLDKFIGDALMVTWNAFKDQPDHATVAVRAALSMQRALDVLNAGWQKQGQAGFRVGIGIATGRVVCGTFGSPHYKLQPTVLGDSVNFASRLETATKEYGCRIIISQSTFEMLDDEFDVRPLGTVAIRGKSEPQTIYEVSGDSSRPLPPERTTLLFPKAEPAPLQALHAPTQSTLSAANTREESTG